MTRTIRILDRQTSKGRVTLDVIDDGQTIRYAAALDGASVNAGIGPLPLPRPVTGPDGARYTHACGVVAMTDAEVATLKAAIKPAPAPVDPSAAYGEAVADYEAASARGDWRAMAAAQDRIRALESTRAARPDTSADADRIINAGL